MNAVDLIILAVVAISVIYGFYHGFLRTVASVVAALLSIGAAFVFGPQLAALFINNSTVTNTLSTYTDAVVRVKDLVLSSTNVAGISQATVESVLASVSLPKPLADVLRENLLTQAFSDHGITTVGGYVSNTIIAAGVQVLCYLLCFAAAYLLMTMLISVLHHVFDVPILKQLDWLAGGVFGLARGLVFVYLLLLLVPFISTVVPMEEVTRLIAESRLAYLFASDGYFVRVISR